MNKIILDKLDWSQNRKVDVNPLKEYLTEKGYVWSEHVNTFLEQFAFLKMDLMHFDVYKAEQEIDSSWILDDYAKRLNETDLCVIGQAYNNHMTLFMDSLGKIYGGYDDCLWFIGHSYELALENIYSNKELVNL